MRRLERGEGFNQFAGIDANPCGFGINGVGRVQGDGGHLCSLLSGGESVTCQYTLTDNNLGSQPPEQRPKPIGAPGPRRRRNQILRPLARDQGHQSLGDIMP
jgi:hypothetical protein